MTKQQYRDYFKRLQKYIKFTPIMEQLGIPRTLFSSFMSGEDNTMSIDRLLIIKNKLEELLKEEILAGERK